MTDFDAQVKAWACGQLRSKDLPFIEITSVDFDIRASGCDHHYGASAEIEVDIFYQRPPEGREKDPQRAYRTVSREQGQLDSLMREVFEYVDTDQ